MAGVRQFCSAGKVGTQMDAANATRGARECIAGRRNSQLQNQPFVFQSKPVPARNQPPPMRLQLANQTFAFRVEAFRDGLDQRFPVRGLVDLPDEVVHSRIPPLPVRLPPIQKQAGIPGGEAEGV